MRPYSQTHTQNPSHSTRLFKEALATKLLKHSTTLAVGEKVVILSLTYIICMPLWR